MFKRVLATTFSLLVVAAGCAFAATTIVDEKFDKLDEGLWRIYTNCDNGQVTVKDGTLVISDVDTGWKQKGITLNKAVDLSAGTTVLEIAYKENGFSQQCPSFMNGNDIEGDDTYNHPGFRVTVGPETSNFEAQSGFGSVSGTIDTLGNDPFDTVGPFTLKWTLKQKDGTIYDTAAFVNGEQKSAAEIDMGEFDVKNAYLYFYVSNNDLEGPAVIDSIKLTQE